MSVGLSGYEFGLPDEYEAVVFGKVLDQEADLFEEFRWDEVGVVDESEEAFAVAVEVSDLGDDVLLQCCAEFFNLYLKRLAEETQKAVPAEDGAVKGDDVPFFLGKLHEGLLEDGFSCAGVSDDNGEATGVGLVLDAGVGVFLVREKLVDEILVSLEGGNCCSVVCFEHDLE